MAQTLSSPRNVPSNTGPGFFAVFSSKFRSYDSMVNLAKKYEASGKFASAAFLYYSAYEKAVSNESKSALLESYGGCNEKAGNLESAVMGNFSAIDYAVGMDEKVRLLKKTVGLVENAKDAPKTCLSIAIVCLETLFYCPQNTKDAAIDIYARMHLLYKKLNMSPDKIEKEMAGKIFLLAKWDKNLAERQAIWNDFSAQQA